MSGNHLSIHNEPWTRLVMERIGQVGNAGKSDGELISLAHYLDVEPGEDPMVDPEVCFVRCTMPVINIKTGEMKDEVQYYPYYIRYVTGREFIYGYQHTNCIKWTGDLRGQKDLASFCNIWARNIKEQGFLTALKEAV